VSTDQKSLLRFGVIAGPFYLALGLAQGLLREGFDFRRHALSHLANGEWGWVQAANFTLTGLMVIAAALGIARALKPASRAMAGFLAAYGIFMIVAAVCTADPVDGFPVGTPAGMPSSISTRGLLHFVAGAMGFVSLAISAFCAMRPLKGRGALSRLSLITGIVVLVGFFAGPFLGGAGIVGIWIAVVVGWAWLALVSKSLMG
jgi:hypothetical protein